MKKLEKEGRLRVPSSSKTDGGKKRNIKGQNQRRKLTGIKRGSNGKF